MHLTCIGIVGRIHSYFVERSGQGPPVTQAHLASLCEARWVGRACEALRAGMISNNSGSVFIRGANWNNGSDAGAFALNLNWGTGNTNNNVGFRCASDSTFFGLNLCTSNRAQSVPQKPQMSFLLWEPVRRENICSRLSRVTVSVPREGVWRKDETRPYAKQRTCMPCLNFFITLSHFKTCIARTSMPARASGTAMRFCALDVRRKRTSFGCRKN